MGAALEQAEKVAAYKGLKMKDALHLRLLTEEMMGLMRSITGEREGIFWIEDEDGEYRLHLQVRTLLNSEEREQLLAVSSSGKNESAKGIMGRIRDFFDWGSDEDLATYTSPLLLPDAFEYTSSPALDWEWSMARYENALSSRLERALPLQRHDFVFRFVKGRFETRQEAVAAGQAVGLEIDRPVYAVILCSGSAGNDHPFDLSLPPFSRLSGYSGAGVELVALKANLYLVFSDDPKVLTGMAETLRCECAAGGERCITSISALHTDFTEAPSAYLEAAAAYENRFVMGSQKVLCYGDISPDLEEILPQARKITTSISQAATCCIS